MVREASNKIRKSYCESWKPARDPIRGMEQGKTHRWENGHAGERRLLMGGRVPCRRERGSDFQVVGPPVRFPRLVGVAYPSCVGVLTVGGTLTGVWRLGRAVLLLGLSSLACARACVRLGSWPAGRHVRRLQVVATCYLVRRRHRVTVVTPPAHPPPPRRPSTSSLTHTPHVGIVATRYNPRARARSVPRCYSRDARRRDDRTVASACRRDETQPPIHPTTPTIRRKPPHSLPDAISPETGPMTPPPHTEHGRRAGRRATGGRYTPNPSPPILRSPS